MEYTLHLAIIVGIYAGLALSLNVASGYTRLVSLAHAGFFGVGAYTTALLAVHLQSPFWLNILMAMLSTGSVGFATAFLARRLVEDYFILATLAVQALLVALMVNLLNLTNGPLGLINIPPLTLAGRAIESKGAFLILTLTSVAAVYFVCNRLARSGYGRSLRALSEDEILVTSLGFDVSALKRSSFAIGAALAAVPGALFAHYTSYIDPSSFGLDTSIFILAAVVMGGLGNLVGGVAASAFFVLLPEALRFAGMSSSSAANVQQMVFGLALAAVVILQARRRGTRGPQVT